LFFAHYLKDKYKLENILEIRKNEYVAFDESNFINIDYENLWVLEAIYKSTKQLSMEISFERTGKIMQKFIFTHIQPGITLYRMIGQGIDG